MFKLFTFGSSPIFIVCSCFCESSYVRAMSRAFSNVRSDPSFINFSLTFENFVPKTILSRTILSGFSHPQSLTKTFKSVTNSSQDSIVFVFYIEIYNWRRLDLIWVLHRPQNVHSIFLLDYGGHIPCTEYNFCPFLLPIS